VGVGHRRQSGVAHGEEAELPGGAEAVLGGPHQPQGVVPVPLHGHHRVHQVLEHPGSGQGAVLGHVADEDEGHLRGLGQPHQVLGAGPHLGDAPGQPGDVGIGHGLDGVDHDEGGRDPVQAAGHGPDVAVLEQQQGGGHRAEALGPQSDLGGRLLGRHEHHLDARRGHGPQHLEQQRRLAHAGLAPEEGDRAGDEAAAEHPVELGQPRGAGGGPRDVDAAQGQGPGGGVPGRRRCAPGRQRDRFLDEGIPLTAGRAAPGPTCRGHSARPTPVHRPQSAHGQPRYDAAVSVRSMAPPGGAIG
jgi:hypothetical protein